MGVHGSGALESTWQASHPAHCVTICHRGSEPGGAFLRKAPVSRTGAPQAGRGAWRGAVVWVEVVADVLRLYSCGG